MKILYTIGISTSLFFTGWNIGTGSWHHVLIGLQAATIFWFLRDDPFCERKRRD